MADGGVWTKIYPDVASLGGGKVLQVVRATDSGDRSTNSPSFEDIEGMSVSITPKSQTSSIVLLCQARVQTENSIGDLNYFRIKWAGPGPEISGAKDNWIGLENITGQSQRVVFHNVNLWGFTDHGTTSEVTYKIQAISSATGTLVRFRNNFSNPLMLAIEIEDVAVSA